MTNLTQKMSANLYRWLTAIALVAFCSFNSNAQITVTGFANTTPDLAASYLTIGDCITALNNTLLTMEGPVTFNVPAGHSETQVSMLVLSNSLNLDFPIIFQKTGIGANPLITRTDAGSTAPSTFGGFGDGVIRLDGNNDITFDGIDLATSNQGIEYGYWLHKPSGTDACQNITIKNCTIDMTRGTSVYVCGIYSSNGTVSTSSATGVTVTANSGRTENLLITGNTITDVFCAVNARGYSTAAFYDQNIIVGTSGSGNGNTFTNYGGTGTVAAYGVYLIYQNNPAINYNTINNAGGGGTAHPNVLYGVFYSTVSGVVTGNNNNITLNSSGTSAVQGLYNANSCTSITFNNNTFFAGTIAATTTSYLIYASSTTPDVTVSGNSTSGTISKTGASGLLYGYYNFASVSTGSSLISFNNFSNIVLSGTSGFTGIRQATGSGHASTVNANTISNITCPGSFIGIEFTYNSGDCNNNTILNITGGAGVTGILAGNSSNLLTSNIYQNNISSMSSTGASTVAGIQSAASGTGSVNNIYKNIICSLSGSNASSLVYGLSITAAKTVNAYNNLVGGLTAPSATGTDAVRGISITNTTTLSPINISYNTIYLNASGAGNFGSSGIFHTTSTTATTSDLTLRNNIIYNNSTPSGTGVTAAYRRSSTTNTNYNALSNRNLFWGGAPDANNLIFTNGTNLYDQLANYQAYIVTQDQNSVTEDVQWESTSCGGVDFLKYDDATASAAESGAANIAGITADVNNTIRQGNVGYLGTGSAPDIGAWELEGALPGCGTPALANTLTTNANPCNSASFTLSLDQAYGLGYTYQWQEATAGAGGPYTNIGGANGATYITSASVTHWYRCVVTCVSSTISTISVEVQVTIATPLNGPYTIDNTGGGDYLTFAAAIADLSCLGVSGPVTFNVIAGQTFVEASNLFCTFTGTSTNTITFQRTGAGANPKIQRIGTAGTTDYILRLVGVDYYTFNGIDFEQTGTSATDWVEYGVLIQNVSATNGSQFNTFKNGVITLAIGNASSNGVYVQSSPTPTAASGTNSDNKFLNMDVGFCKIGYNITGATATFNDNNNEINTELGGTSTIHDIGDGIAAGSTYGIFASYQSNLKIKNTDISNVLGTSTTLVYGITLQSSASNSADISDNTIIGVSGGGTSYGIYITSAATANIYNNEVTSIYTAGSASSVRGIYVTATGVTSNIYNNKVHLISSTGITGTTAAGIDVATGLVHNIYNNMVSDITAPSSTTTTGGTRGISVSGGSTGGVVSIYYNSVYLNDVGAVAGYTSAGIHNSSATPTLDIRNNVIENVSDVTTGTLAVAFWKTAATDNVSPNCNNNLYYAGTPSAKNLIYYDGTNSIQTIPAYQGVGAIAPAETVTQTEDVTWQPILNGVLRPDAVIPTVIEGGAQVIAGYATDFEADTRNITNPDIGADEGTFTIYVPPVPDCATYDAPANGATDICSYGTVVLDWTAAITGGPVTLGYDVYFGTSPTPPFITNVTVTNYSPTGLLPNTTYYWQIVPKNGTGDATGCATWSFTTINAVLTTANGDTRCGPGTVNLTATGAGTFNWYTAASGGSPVATGSPYSPSVVGTTNYWVSASDGGTNGNVGPLNSSIGAGASSTIVIGTQQLFFDVLAPSMTINTVTIYPTATIGSSFTIVIQNSSAVQVYSSGPILTTVTSAGGTVPQVVTLNATLPAGTGYRFGFSTNPGMWRNSAGAVYSYTLPGVVSITGNSFDVNYYYFFYNWSVSTGCESPRTMVTATVETPATANANSDQAVCAGSTATMAGSFGGSATSATWSTTGDGNFNNASLMNAIYTPGPNDISNGSVVLTLTTDDPAGICNAASDNMTLTINPTPVVTGTPTDVSCYGSSDGSIDITISGGTAPVNCAWTGPTFSAIVVPKTPAHPYFGVGSGSGWEIDGVEGKELTLVRGVTYTFAINAPGHPFYISTDPDGAGAGEVTSGVTGSQTDFGILTFTPNVGHPNLLYYQCYAHLNMGWKINIVDGITNCDLTGLMPGNYSVIVTDANGCTDTDSYAINEPAGIVYYADTDGDTYGDASNTTLGGCTPPSGYVTNDDDCNDAVATIYPGAPEICNDGIDQDCNGSDVTTAPAQPSVISGAPLDVCPPATGINLSVTNDPNVATYVWATGPGTTGVTFNPPSSTNTQTIDLGASTNSTYGIRVTAFNACGSSPYRSVSIRRAVSTPAAVSGPTTVCALGTYGYSTGAVTGATSYLWSGPVGTMFDGSNPTPYTTVSNSVTATLPAGFTSGTIGVAAQVACFTSTVKTLVISATPAVIGIMTGATTVCPNTAYVYSVPLNAAVATYNWTLPVGASGSSTTNSITVTYGATVTSSNICVTGTSICGSTTAARCMTTNGGSPARPASITGPQNGLCGQTVLYTCPAVPGATAYTWSTTAGGTINSGQGTNGINITYPSFTNTPAKTLCVVSSNACGTSASRCITLNGSPNSPAGITASPTSWCDGATGITFTANLTGVTGSYVLNWTYPGATVATYSSGGGNSTTLILDWVDNSGVVGVIASNACGSGSRNVTFGSTCRQGEVVAVNNNFTVYPNPTSSVFNVEFTSTSNQDVVIAMFDLAGKVIYTQSVNTLEGLNNQTIDVTQFAKGMYLLTLKTSEGTYQQKVSVE